ncbi:hypothetical protein RHA1_ro11072 (plasmid) [Rhodococcus jostii RHA1]|uniref:Uncharacterized protein n=1 Tax=Rhodococcus jostii (strain RHA1) TaxID=101510 RepID=Q0RVG7_RHOJR|nr:hypothetical protein RHA1_ro11072 [Rhodococcus jostii RHA1]
MEPFELICCRRSPVVAPGRCAWVADHAGFSVVLVSYSTMCRRNIRVISAGRKPGSACSRPLTPGIGTARPICHCAVAFVEERVVDLGDLLGAVDERPRGMEFEYVFCLS